MAARARRVGRAIAANPLFSILLGLGVVLRVIVAVAYRPALPFRNNDAYEYVLRALTLSAAGSFHPFLYSLLLKPLLITHDLMWVTVAQHLAGLAMAVALYVLLRRLGVHPVVAALGVAPVLLDGYQLDIEHQLLSEAFFQVFIVAALVLLAWDRRPALPAAAAAGALIALASLIRFVGLAAIVAALIYVLLRRAGWVRVVTILVAFLVPLAAYGLWFRSVSGSFGITNRNGFYLYGRVVSFADCREVPVPTDLQVFCPRGQTNGGLFTSGLPKSIRRDPSYNAKAMAFAKRMIRAKPGAYVAAVLSDFLKYFEPGTPQHRDSYAGMWRFQEDLTARDQRRIPPGITTTFRIDRPLAVFLNGYQGVVWVYGPLLAILLMMGLAGGVAGWAKSRGRTLAPEAWLFTLAALGLLLFPPVFAVYHFRYVLPVLPLVGCAGALGVAAVAGSGRPEPAAEGSTA